MSKTKSNKPAPLAKPPTATKKDRLLTLLRREGGATIADLAQELGWLPHTTRAMLTGLRKQGFALAKAKAEGGTRYSIAAEPQP